MNELALTGLSGDARIEVTERFLRRRDEALADAKAITVIENESGQNGAVAVLSDLKALMTGIESTRKAIKQPVVELGKKIDAVAADAVLRITQEEARVKSLLETFLLEKEREAILRHEAAIAEAQERQRAIDAELERVDRLKKDAEDKANRLTRPSAIEAAGRRADELGAQVNKLDVQAENARREVDATEALTPAEQKPVGASVRKVRDFEVEDMQLLAERHPSLVTITPKRADILKIINQWENNAEIDGLRIFETTRISVR